MSQACGSQPGDLVSDGESSGHFGAMVVSGEPIAAGAGVIIVFLTACGEFRVAVSGGGAHVAARKNSSSVRPAGIAGRQAAR